MRAGYYYIERGKRTENDRKRTENDRKRTENDRTRPKIAVLTTQTANKS